MPDLEKADALLIVAALVAFSHGRRIEQPRRANRALPLAAVVASEYELSITEALNELTRLELEGQS